MLSSSLGNDSEARQRALVRQVLAAAVEAADPRRVVREALALDGRRVLVRGEAMGEGEVLVLGAGKAAAAMASGAWESLGDRITRGLVVVKDGCTANAGPSVRVVEAGHPVPTLAGVTAARAMLELARQARASDLVLLLLSGGASALLPMPADGLHFEDELRATELLLGCGATIHEMNCVRKHLSGIKGGRLAAAAVPAPMAVLVISDVVGNDLATIGSGPAAPDPSTYADAWEIVRRLGLQDRLPAAVETRLRDGDAPETLKPGDPALARVRHHVLADHSTGLKGALAAASRLGFRTCGLSAELGGEAADLGARFAELARRQRVTRRIGEPPSLVAGSGETVVRVRGDGLGGRCTEFALAAARQLDALDGVLVAGFATDGSDGTTGAAGAFASGDSASRGRELGMDPEDFLRRNDSFTYFERLGDLIQTGPTLTNVGDLYVASVFGP